MKFLLPYTPMLVKILKIHKKVKIKNLKKINKKPRGFDAQLYQIKSEIEGDYDIKSELLP